MTCLEVGNSITQPRCRTQRHLPFCPESHRPETRSLWREVIKRLVCLVRMRVSYPLCTFPQACRNLLERILPRSPPPLRTGKQISKCHCWKFQLTVYCSIDICHGVNSDTSEYCHSVLRTATRRLFC